MSWLHLLEAGGCCPLTGKCLLAESLNRARRPPLHPAQGRLPESSLAPKAQRGSVTCSPHAAFQRLSLAPSCRSGPSVPLLQGQSQGLWSPLPAGQRATEKSWVPWATLGVLRSLSGPQLSRLQNGRAELRAAGTHAPGLGPWPGASIQAGGSSSCSQPGPEARPPPGERQEAACGQTGTQREKQGQGPAPLPPTGDSSWGSDPRSSALHPAPIPELSPLPSPGVKAGVWWVVGASHASPSHGPLS